VEELKKKGFSPIVLDTTKNDNTIMPPICPQPLEAFEYDNCYSHHAYYEGSLATPTA
jgi:hypothetical protein